MFSRHPSVPQSAALYAGVNTLDAEMLTEQLNTFHLGTINIADHIDCLEQHETVTTSGHF